MLGKLIKVCDLFNCSRFYCIYSRYNIPNKNEIGSELRKLADELIEKNKFLEQSKSSLRDFFHDKIGYVVIA
jgi:hypothetical protein